MSAKGPCVLHPLTRLGSLVVPSPGCEVLSPGPWPVLFSVHPLTGDLIFDGSKCPFTPLFPPTLPLSYWMLSLVPATLIGIIGGTQQGWQRDLSMHMDMMTCLRLTVLLDSSPITLLPLCSVESVFLELFCLVDADVHESSFFLLFTKKKKIGRGGEPPITCLPRYPPIRRAEVPNTDSIDSIWPRRAPLCHRPLRVSLRRIMLQLFFRHHTRSCPMSLY